ncbi:hypothetical protein Micbo1qcDRAFT_124941 [Microdochium bolleyi]|uniref:Zn(2)-C6 fungal-type domain-containing protein n=1 Tax=Microdochium bolleyi TaxID=196109 RepID=A0A136IQM0_9PEZI|nr:hypothetical protein Micbo1qcDRAFT_124941 [Microdochium bolleyi]
MPTPPSEPKARKACINCRKQKMRCTPANGRSDTCRRCHRAGLPCVFVPRANAATLPDLPGLDSRSPEVPDEHFKRDVLGRLRLIEDCLGLSSATPTLGDGETSICETGHETTVSDFADDDMFSDPAMSPLWDALAVLRQTCPAGAVPAPTWRKAAIVQLWSAFHERMPGLHFMPDKELFSSPSPVLLAAILYCSSTRGPPDVAEAAPHYFTVLCTAIAHLSIPGSAVGRVPESLSAASEWAFQTVLGIVLTGLLTEANVRETGLWISVAYRLLLEHAPALGDDSARKWRRLFSGVQIVDLEHASLHLSCPVIPIESPLPVLQSSHGDQLYWLSRMMHAGLSHFTGRRLPTIWSCFTDSDPAPVNDSLTSSLTPVDAAVIRDWARQLDEWLVEFSKGPQGAEQNQKLIFRQYVLHRLVVLSIYHPARGCNLWSRNISPVEQHELLLSAQTTLKLHLHDDTIWSNWDLVMITWAALIVIQGIEGGVGQADDLQNIRVHLAMLKRMTGPNPGLCDKLIARLEQSLQGVQTPQPTTLMHPDEQQQGGQGVDIINDGSLDYSWQIFDHVSLQQFDHIL